MQPALTSFISLAEIARTISQSGKVASKGNLLEVKVYLAT